MEAATGWLGRRGALLVRLGLVCSLVWGGPLGGLARAQGGPSPEQKRAAAEAYDRRTQAWLAGQYARAARFFETAYRAVPAAPALLQAVRAHERAGNAVRAATLALLLKERYPEDSRAMAVAERVLLEQGPSLTRVEVACEHCTLEVDGAIVDQRAFFVEPGVDHEVVAGFETGVVRRTVRGEAGETVRLQFEAPPPPERPASSPPEAGAGGAADAGRARPATRPGEPLVAAWVPVTLGIATVAAGAATIWSGIDTLTARDEYVAAPTRERYEEGVALERRTNILIGVTSAFGVATAVTTLLAITRGDPEEVPPSGVSVRPGLRYVRGGAMAMVRVRWR